VSPNRSRRRTTFLPNYEQPYDALFEQTNDAVVILSSDGHYVAANQRATEMLGYSEEELIGTHMNQIVVPDELEEAAGRMQALLAGDPVPIYERTLRRKDGSLIPVEINASLVRDEQGRVAYFQSVARDISDRKQEERALRLIAEGTAGSHGENFFDALVQHLAQTLDVQCAIVTLRLEREPEAARILAWWHSDAHAEAVEYVVSGTPTERVYDGETVFEPTDVRSRFNQDHHIATLGATSYFGIPLRDTESAVIGHLAVMDNKPMGNELRRGSVLRIFAARAASEINRLRANRRQSESEARYQMLVEQLPAITYTAALDAESTALYISPQVEKILGYTAEEFSVRPSRWRKQLHPDDRDEILARLARAIQESLPFRMEYRIFRKDGSLAWIRDEAVIVHSGDGTPQLLQGIMVDITVEKRLTEELLNARKLESVGMLAGGIAHDFNNTLMGILGNLSIAKNRIDAEHNAHNRIIEAEKAALRAKGLTQQLLTFSKGGAPVRRSTSMLGVICDTLPFALSGSNVELKLEIDDDLWPADVDAGQISQVLENLALNSAQAMEQGGTLHASAGNVELEARSGIPVRPGRFICIRVRDEGGGIDPDVVDRIFDPYFTTKEHGSGLGLATSYAIVQKHDGHIGVRSNADCGAEFVIYLPAGEPVDESEAVELEEAASPRARILVLDDDEMVLDAVATMLEGLGHEATFVSDGQQAVDCYREALQRGERFDVALLDLTIRGGFGGEVVMRRLLEIDPQAVGVVSSGYSDSPIMAEAQRFGFREHLAKPYQPNELKRLLSQLLYK